MSATLPKDTAVVMLAKVPWNFTWQSDHKIATGLAKRGYAVTFVQPLPKRMPAASEAAFALAHWLNRPEVAGYRHQPRPPSVDLVSPMVFPDINRAFKYANRVALVPRLTRHLRHLGMGRKQTVVITYLPFPLPMAVARALAPDLLVYASFANWASASLATRRKMVEEELFAAADLVLANSPLLVERARRQHSRVYRWPGTVDFERFHAVAQVVNRPAAERPVRTCYYGAVGAHIDVELLAKVSHHTALRILGPVLVPMIALAPGSELPGMVPYPQVAENLKDVDVLLLPYRVSELTEGLFPAKIFECFATGKPIVSTYLPSLLPYGRLVYISRTHEEFVENIGRAIDEPQELGEQRIQVARENTTDRWMETLSNWLLTALAEKG